VSALVDAGPLVSVVTGDDEAAFFASAIDREQGRLLTTQACLTEAFHLIGRESRWQGIEPLFDLISGAGIKEAELPTDHARARTLMTRYRNLPMDFADATLVLLAEATDIRRIITTDRRDFSAYRIRGRIGFDVIAAD
jgi:uncharacterized protein